MTPDEKKELLQTCTRLMSSMHDYEYNYKRIDAYKGLIEELGSDLDQEEIEFIKKNLLIMFESLVSSVNTYMEYIEELTDKIVNDSP